ncbi:hypothetical protein PG999_002821 [Apiospora kogelbergensis]|uniref:Uncharacterized protein n=1 Tax=Apiospora kogelbergensis TaxID=1337665 RepID=A0AAW0R9L2_9PEZI
MRPSVPALCLALPYPILQVFFFIASFLVVFTVAFLGLAIIVASPLLIKAATNHLMMSNRGGTEYAPLFRGIGVSELQMTCGSTLSRLSHFGQCILSSVMAVWLPTVFQAMFPRQSLAPEALILGIAFLGYVENASGAATNMVEREDTPATVGGNGLSLNNIFAIVFGIVGTATPIAIAVWKYKTRTQEQALTHHHWLSHEGSRGPSRVGRQENIEHAEGALQSLTAHTSPIAVPDPVASNTTQPRGHAVSVRSHESLGATPNQQVGNSPMD